jgi:hypothetical protein
MTMAAGLNSDSSAQDVLSVTTTTATARPINQGAVDQLINVAGMLLSMVVFMGLALIFFGALLIEQARRSERWVDCGVTRADLELATQEQSEAEDAHGNANGDAQLIDDSPHDGGDSPSEGQAVLGQQEQQRRRKSYRTRAQKHKKFRHAFRIKKRNVRMHRASQEARQDGHRAKQRVRREASPSSPSNPGASPTSGLEPFPAFDSEESEMASQRRGS